MATDDADNRELVRRFTDASVAADIDTIATMLRDDVRYAMPPWAALIIGRDAVSPTGPRRLPEMTGLRARADVGQPPACGRLLHLARGGVAYVPLTLDVPRISNGTVTEVTIFGAEQFRTSASRRGRGRPPDEAARAHRPARRPRPRPSPLGRRLAGAAASTSTVEGRPASRRRASRS